MTPASTVSAVSAAFRALRGLVYRGSLGLMFRLRPERIHGLMATALHTAAGITPVRRGLRALLPVTDPALAQRIAGLDFPRPLGLAAGFDKDATMADIWGPLGFGFAEVGTVTAVAQPGNPTPRMFRFPADHAILNRMGFNNHGALAAARQLAGRREYAEPGGREPREDEEDPRRSRPGGLLRVRPRGPRRRRLPRHQRLPPPTPPVCGTCRRSRGLRPIVAAVRRASDRPLFVKIAPDLSDEDVDAVTDLAPRTRPHRTHRDQHDDQPGRSDRFPRRDRLLRGRRCLRTAGGGACPDGAAPDPAPCR
jgi:dihydroorotate dehydrogenase